MTNVQEMKVVVLKGGRSAEREVSLRSGAKIAGALRAIGYQVDEYDTQSTDYISRLLQSPPDIVFPALHGHYGEDGTVQGLCELLDIPYVGSGVLASALAINKVMSKQMFACTGLPTPEYVVLYGGPSVDLSHQMDLVWEKLGEHVVVKPADEGSSIGMTMVHRREDLKAALDLAYSYDSQVLVEKFIEGIEVTVGVLGNETPRALPTIEVVAGNEFYDYESKYQPGMSQHIIPARVSDEINELCERLAEQAHQLLGCRGISRSDFIVDASNQVWLLETNTLPGMTDTSLVPDAARVAGVDFEALCEMLIQFALDE